MQKSHDWFAVVFCGTPFSPALLLFLIEETFEFDAIMYINLDI